MKKVNLFSTIKNLNTIKKISFTDHQDSEIADKNTTLKNLFRSIFLDQSWVHRVNETINFSENKLSSEINFSIDCTPPKTLPKYADPFSDSPNDKPQSLIPIAVLQKETLTNLDIKISEKSAPTITSSVYNSLMVSIVESFTNEVLRDSLSNREISEINKIVEEIIYAKPFEKSSAEQDTEIEEFISKIKEVVSQSPNKDLLSESHRLLEEVLYILYQNFILFVVSSEPLGKRVIIKYSYEASGQQNDKNSLPTGMSQEQSSIKKWITKGIPTYSYSTTPRIWRPASHHITLTTPNKLNIILSEYPDGASKSSKTPPYKIKFILPKIDNNDLSYSQHSFDFTCAFIPDRSGIKTFTLFTTIFLFLISLASIPIRLLDLSPDFRVPNSSIGLLTSSLTLLLAYLANEPEHHYIQKTLKPYRLVLGLSSLSLFMLSILCSIPLQQKIPIVSDFFNAGWTIWDFTWLAIYGIISYTTLRTLFLLYREKVIKDLDSINH